MPPDLKLQTLRRPVFVILLPDVGQLLFELAQIVLFTIGELKRRLLGLT